MPYTIRPNGDRFDRREIWIRRESAPSPQDEPSVATATLDELITLAHERGHNESDRRGTYRAMSIAEEHRAWKHARDLLETLGFDDWDALNAQQDYALAEHVKRGTGP